MIDEKKLIEAVEREADNRFAGMKSFVSLEAIKQWLEGFPKVDVPEINVGKWIPCSERLPETDGRFEVTIKGCKGKRHVEMCNYCKDAKAVFGNEKWGGENVIAWRQRPEPYKGEQHD